MLMLQEWEEVTDMSLIVLTRTISQGSEASSRHQPSSWNRFESTRDLAKLKKRLAHALEKLQSSGGAAATIKESLAEDAAAAAAS